MKIIKSVAAVALLSFALPVGHADAVSKAGYPTSKYKKGAPKKFSKCKDLNKYYRYGVTDSHISYTKGLDRDKDHMACEAKDMKYQDWMKNN